MSITSRRFAKPLRIALTVLVAAFLLVAADGMLRPVPLPAAMAVAGGIIGMWLTPARRTGVAAIGLIVGVAAGVAVHVYVHGTAQSPLPSEGLPSHLLQDAAVGLGVALLILTAVLLVDLMVGRSLLRAAADQNNLSYLE